MWMRSPPTRTTGATVTQEPPLRATSGSLMKWSMGANSYTGRIVSLQPAAATEMAGCAQEACAGGAQRKFVAPWISTVVGTATLQWMVVAHLSKVLWLL